MDCRQFEDRMNDLLDQRADPRADQNLCDHASGCARCDDALRLWGLIHQSFQPHCDESFIDPDVQPVSNQTKRYSGAFWTSVLAASLLLVVVNGLPRGSGRPVPKESSDATVDHTTPKHEFAMSPLNGDSVGNRTAALSWSEVPWWSVVQEEKWVRSTIPAMDSVRQGVAPIGRSMKQAMAILMNHRSIDEVDSLQVEPSAIDSSIKSSSIQEQTFHSPNKFEAGYLA